MSKFIAGASMGAASAMAIDVVFIVLGYVRSRFAIVPPCKKLYHFNNSSIFILYVFI